MRTVIFAAMVVVAAPFASAQTSDALAARAKVCDAATSGKRLSNEQYRSFMRSCLASDERPQDLFQTARTIERRCNTIANSRQLTAQDRVTFMQSCRSKGG
jgi:hypothetical protein